MKRRATYGERERLELHDEGQPRSLTDTRPSRAVSRSKSIGRSSALGVRPDRFEHEVEFIGAIDLARYRIGHAGPEEQGFGEVIESINALRVLVPQQEHRTLLVFRPCEQEQMIGAEVEHVRRG